MFQHRASHFLHRINIKLESKFASKLADLSRLKACFLATLLDKICLMLKIITVTGYKGGVGKSTTAIHLASYFSARGKTVLVDGDANRTAITWAARGAFPFTVGDE